MSLQARLIRYLKNNEGKKFAKGELADLARQKGGYTGETTGRRLRIMHEASTVGPNPQSPCYDEQLKALELLDGAVIQCERRNKNHCFYWCESGTVKKPQQAEIKVINGVPTAIYGA